MELSTEAQRGVLNQLIRYASLKRSRDRIPSQQSVNLDLTDCLRVLVTPKMQEILEQYKIEFEPLKESK
jgi:hypothetical protein